jgi:predicted Zn finger-like uncharacterized protein
MAAMRVGCDSCGREFSLPEDKLPDAQRFRVKCPSCGNRITVERPSDGSGDGGVSGEPVRESGEQDTEGAEYAGLTPDRAKNGLLLFSDEGLLEAVRAPLEENGYTLVATATSGTAIRIFYANPLSLVVVEDTRESDALLREVHSQPGITRREINCILVGDGDRSLDRRQAFYRGVNVYLAREDRDHFRELLPRALGAYWQFIHPWLVARDEV